MSLLPRGSKTEQRMHDRHAAYFNNHPDGVHTAKEMERIVAARQKQAAQSVSADAARITATSGGK